AGGDASLSAGQDLIIASAEAENGQMRKDKRHFWSSTSTTQYGSDVQVGGNLAAEAGRDLAVIASKVKAGGDVDLLAGGDVLIGAAANESSSEYRYNRGSKKKINQENSSVRQQMAEIEAGGDLLVGAGGDMTLIASRLKSAGDVQLVAEGDLSLLPEANQDYRFYQKSEKKKGSFGSSKSKKVKEENSTIRQQGVEIEAGGDLLMSTEANLTMAASKLKAGGEAYLYAGEQINLLAVQNSDYSLYDMKKKGGWGSKKTQRDEVTTVRNVGSEITTGGDLTLVSEGNQLYQRARLESGGDLTLDSGGSITFEGVKDLDQESHEKSKSSWAWTSAKGKGNTDETLQQSQLIAQGDIVIQAVEGLKIDVKQVNQQSVSQTINAMVAADPELAWLKEMEQRGDVDWRQVKEVHDSFKYSHSGLGGPAMIIIAIIVTYLTAGAASGLIGGAAGATAGSGTAMAAGTAATATTAATSAGWANIALTAVATSATSNAAISTINNRGDLGAVLKDVTSKDALKGYATSAAVAGLAGYTDSWGRELTVDGNYKLVNATERFQAYAMNTALKGLLSGEDNAKSWLTIAGTGAMMELYQYSVGRAPDARPGVDRPDGANFDSSAGVVPRVTVDGVVREGKNIGLNLPLDVDVCKSFYSVCHGTAISNGLNNIPGFNSFATLHDQWMISLEMHKGGDMNVFENIGSMPPALLVNYGAIYEKYRPLIEASKKKNAK
ncbi:MAG: hemagglutinin repeat-containing protein, partial [Pseudomonas sp.]|uniref:hemagglutinin repeat-containing protein n=1 Tax=Pseudomonas sp. TaxID=306 RepID=UPI00271F1308